MDFFFFLVSCVKNNIPQMNAIFLLTNTGSFHSIFNDCM